MNNNVVDIDLDQNNYQETPLY